ncbi:MAG: helix-turn-helix transcriptional regulator [Acidobacteria bacterium]|nr:helix-turn-helix transcriptional regulator [Acidobacteriota bacterium]
MPVYSSHLAADYRTLGVGIRIQQERRAKGFTLRRLSRQVQISPAQLSNIENGKAKLNVAQLARIAGALGQSVASLLPRSDEYPYLIARREQIAAERPRPILPVGAERQASRSHNFSSPLAERFIGKHMVPVLAEIHPLADENLQLIGHHREEFLFALRGDVETLIKTNTGFVTAQLHPGDCMYLRSYLPHCHRSMTSEPAQILSVSYSMRRPIDPEDDEFGEADGPSFYRRSYRADVPKEIAEKIALLRRSSRRTLEDLARSVGIGSRQLAAVERGTKALELDLLLRLAREFKRPVDYFLTETSEAGPSHTVVDRTGVANTPGRSRKLPRAGHVYRPLASGFADRGLHPYYLQMKGTQDGFDQHAGQEFLYVLDGEVELSVQLRDRVVGDVLKPGDALFLDASAPHRLRGRSQNPYAEASAELIAVFWSPTGEQALFD